MITGTSPRPYRRMPATRANLPPIPLAANHQGVNLAAQVPQIPPAPISNLPQLSQTPVDPAGPQMPPANWRKPQPPDVDPGTGMVRGYQQPKDRYDRPGVTAHPGGFYMQSGPLADAAMTPYTQWTPEMHQAYNKDHLPQYSLHNLNNQRMAAMNSLSNRNIQQLAGVGDPSYVNPGAQKDIRDSVSANSLQKQRNMYTASERKIMQLPQAQSQPQNQLPVLEKGSRFSVPEGQSYASSPEYRSRMIPTERGTAFVGTGVLRKMEALEANGMSKPDALARATKDSQAATAESVKASREEAASRPLSMDQQKRLADKDQMILKNAAKYNLDPSLPNIDMAKARTQGRVQKMLDEAEFGPSGGGLKKASEGAARFRSSEFGKLLEPLAQGNNVTGIKEKIDKYWDTMGPQDRHDFQHWFEMHPKIAEGISGAHNNDLNSIRSRYGKGKEKAPDAIPPTPSKSPISFSNPVSGFNK